MPGSQGQIRIPLTLDTLEVPILSIHHLSILPFRQDPFPLPQELPRGIQLSPQLGLLICHNQGIQDASHQVPTLLHTHHLPLACLL